MPFQRITVEGNIHVVDHESFGENERETSLVFGEAVVATDFVAVELLRARVGVGGEVRAELELYAKAQSSGLAEITGIARLFEGSSEDTDDLEEEAVLRYFAQPGNGTKEQIYLHNHEFDSRDYATFDLTISNFPAGVIVTSGGDLSGSLPKQDGWHWCHKCQGMWFGGDGGTGRCPTGAGHSLDGSGNYSLIHTVAYPGGQPQWRWCHKCLGLWFSGGVFGDFGWCPVGGGHSSAGSGNYMLTDHPSPKAQDKWRWCHSCTGMWFSGNPSKGRCPRNGNAHSQAGSGDYKIIVN